MKGSRYLVWLEWPEKCFRADAEALLRLAELSPGRPEIVRVRSERAFLRELPSATHAFVWSFSPEWFANAPRLRLLATPAAGRELVPEKGPPGVRIHFGSFHGPIMAETVLAFMLAWRRGFFALARDPRCAGKAWPRTELGGMCSLVAGTSAVIAGFGNVGRAIGRALEACGASAVGITRHGAFAGAANPRPISQSALDERIAHADWFVLALPSTTGTDGYLGSSLLRRLPRKCVVVNVGRGNAVDERALYDALVSKRIAGAYLDVRRHEPTAEALETPGGVPELADLPNCIVTPHSSAFDRGYLSSFFAELAAEGLLA